MINQELAIIFEKMAHMLEFHGNPDDAFKIRAYKNVATLLLEISEPLHTLLKEGKLTTIPGIGQGIALKIKEYIEKGFITEFRLLQRTVPHDFFELIRIPTLGPKKVKMLFDKLNITTISDLKKALQENRIASLPRFGEKSAHNIDEGLAMLQQNMGRRLRGEVSPFVAMVIKILLEHPAISRAVIAGSYRRGEQTIGDIDILVTGTAVTDTLQAKSIMDYCAHLPFVTKILGQGETKTSVITTDGLQVDVRLVEEKQFGSALQYFTGSKAHNVHIRNIAKARGLKVSEYGVFEGKKVIASKTEEQCYQAIGLAYIPPEIRTDRGEIEAAKKNAIPPLIECSNIRGDLHVHSTYSDGVHSIEKMVSYAQKMGYEYIAITDHSPSLKIANGLSVARLQEKKKEIEVLQDHYNIHILFGTEVDILVDGSIDYSDTILKQFDVVVASVHSHFQQDNTERIIRAMENPYVHIIAHPSGRMINVRNGYSLAYEKIFKKATETGTALEINAQPARLDLQDIYLRSAISEGCFFSINSDAHSIEGLTLIDNGVTWARRGWVEKKHVINTLPLSQLRRFFKAKLSNR